MTSSAGARPLNPIYGAETRRFQKMASQIRDIETRGSRMNEAQEEQDPEELDPPRQPSPCPPEANVPPPLAHTAWTREAAHYAGLVLASMLGCLVRLGLNGLMTYDGMVIYALAWVQGVGCGVMGLALARKNEIVGLYPPLYTFFTTGIAGSITTFSSWMLYGYLSFANFEGYDRGGLYDTIDGLAYSFSTFLISIAALRFGEQVSRILPSAERIKCLRTARHVAAHDRDDLELPRLQPNEARESSSTHSTSTPIAARAKSADTEVHKRQRRLFVTDLVWISTAGIAYLIALLLYFFAPTYYRHRAVFPILLSPPGAFLRFVLARLNAKPRFIDRFPLGTFIANMGATAILAGTFAAQRRPGTTDDSTRCNALYAIEQGFCGCLSTVSTFVVETRTIKGLKWTWGYVLLSVVLGHVLVLAIVSGVQWSEGYVTVCTGYY